MGGAVTITGAAAIRMAQLCAQWHCLSLEAKGLQRRGRSVKAMLGEAYGVGPRARLATVAQLHVLEVRRHAQAHGLPVPGWAEVPQ